MHRCFYKFEQKTADVLFSIVELVLIALLAERAIRGVLIPSVVLAGTAVALAILRFKKGPLVGPPLVEVTTVEMIFRSFFYFPVKTQKNRLESIKALKVAGPRGDRRFRFSLVDGTQEEFRPYYGRLLEPKIVDFLRNALPKDIPLIEEEPPSVLSQMRGDF